MAGCDRMEAGPIGIPAAWEIPWVNYSNSNSLSRPYKKMMVTGSIETFFSGLKRTLVSVGMGIAQVVHYGRNGNCTSYFSRDKVSSFEKQRIDGHSQLASLRPIAIQYQTRGYQGYSDPIAKIRSLITHPPQLLIAVLQSTRLSGFLHDGLPPCVDSLVRDNHNRQQEKPHAYESQLNSICGGRQRCKPEFERRFVTYVQACTVEHPRSCRC